MTSHDFKFCICVLHGVCVCGMVCACGICICMFSDAPAHVCVPVAVGAKGWLWALYLMALHLCFSRTGSLTKPSSSAELDCLANKLQRPTCATPTPNAEVTEVCHHAWHLTEVSSSPHTCEANTLQTEPSLQPKYHIWMKTSETAFGVEALQWQYP